MKVRKVISWLNPLNAKYKTFGEFWPHYATLHKEPKVSDEHLRGTLRGLFTTAPTTLATSIGICAVDRPDLWYIIPAVLSTVFACVTYPIVVPSHKKHGNNEAASLENIWHGVLSIAGDFKMCTLKLRGKWEKELKRLEQQLKISSEIVAINNNS